MRLYVLQVVLHGVTEERANELARAIAKDQAGAIAALVAFADAAKDQSCPSPPQQLS